MKKEKTVEEVLAEYPKEIVDFFHTKVNLECWDVETKLGGCLPSLIQQLSNKFSHTKNEETYEVTFTFKKIL